MPDITIIDNTDETGETSPEVLEGEKPIVEAEALADAAVEIAQIEADKEVKIAEIQADVVKEHDSDVVEAIKNEDEEWRRNIEAKIAAQEAQNSEILSALQALREPPPNRPEKSENPEAMPESQEAPEPAPPKRQPHHRLI